MLCTTCRQRPAASATGRCVRCTALYPSPPHGLMPGGPAPTAEGLHLLRSPEGLSKAVVALFGAVIATDALAMAAEVHLWRTYAGADGFTFVALERLRRAESLSTLAVGLQSLAYLATAVLFLLWFRRVRGNAEVFDAGMQPMRRGWAIGAWFVPVGNLWLPRRIAGGIWSASTVPGTGQGGRSGSQALLNLWWGAWICTLLFARYAERRYDRAVVFDDVMGGLRLLIVSDALDVLAAVLALLFVRRLTAMQRERACLYVDPRPEPGTVLA
ncbi:DUF4328 domain-containing protein [Streptomyces sp. NPDC058330]|uniref:DUF4328 domain-containing protein n=1 Tax=Streptomyces sp. NPDC058330 TaxID=3346449 RepID=UPI0036E7D34D